RVFLSFPTRRSSDLLRQQDQVGKVHVAVAVEVAHVPDGGAGEVVVVLGEAAQVGEVDAGVEVGVAGALDERLGLEIGGGGVERRSEEHTSELQSLAY